MFSDYGLYIGIGLVGIVTVALVSSFPPITQSDEPIERLVGSATLPSIADDYGYAYCQSQAEDIDCDCFAKTAAEVLTYDTPQAHGWNYVDRWDLARAQSYDNCS